MRRSFSNTNFRTALMVSAGGSMFLSAAFILVVPRVGTILLEVFLGLILVGWALMTRLRMTRPEDVLSGSKTTPTKWFDRYDALMVFALIVLQSFVGHEMRHLHFSEGVIQASTLALFGIGVLSKSAVIRLAEGRRQRRQELASDGRHDLASPRGVSTVADTVHAQPGTNHCNVNERGGNRC